MPSSAERAAARRASRSLRSEAGRSGGDPALDPIVLPGEDPLTMLDRAAAAQWLAERGLTKMTGDWLRQNHRSGPPYVLIGRTPYYRLGELRAWLAALPVAGGSSRAA